MSIQRVVYLVMAVLGIGGYGRRWREWSAKEGRKEVDWDEVTGQLTALFYVVGENRIYMLRRHDGEFGR